MEACRCHVYAAQPTEFTPQGEVLSDLLEHRGGFLRRHDWIWHGIPVTEKGEHSPSEKYYACTLCGKRWRVKGRSIFDKSYVRWECVDGSPELEAHYQRPSPPVPDCACSGGTPLRDPRTTPDLHVARAHWTDREHRFIEWFTECQRCRQRWKVTHDAKAGPLVYHWEQASSFDNPWYLARIPWSEEALERALAELTAPPTKALADCSVCHALPDFAYRFTKGGEVQHDSIPEGTSRLVPVMKLEHRDGLSICRCPECGRLYDMAHSYEFLVGGSEDEDTLQRLEPGAVRERLRGFLGNYVGISSMYKDGETWVISFSSA